MIEKKYGKTINFNYLTLYNENIINLLDLLTSSFESNQKTKEVNYDLSITIKLDIDVSHTYTNKQDFIKDFTKFNKVKELEIYIYDNLYTGNSIVLRMNTNNGLLFNGGYLSISTNDEKFYKILIYDFNDFLRENLGVMGKTPKKIINWLMIFMWICSLIYFLNYLILKIEVPLIILIIYIILVGIISFTYIIYEFSGNRLYFNDFKKIEIYTFKSFIKWLGSQVAGIILGIVISTLITFIAKVIR